MTIKPLSFFCYQKIEQLRLEGDSDFMKQIVEAIYENGVFKPVKPLIFFEGQQVQLEIEDLSEANPDDLLELAAMVYDGLTDQEIDEVEEVATDRRDFFGESFK